MQFIEELKAKGHLVAYVGDVVGTGSSRKSRHQQRDLGAPARTSRSCRTSASAASRWAARSPRSSTTRMEDSGALPIEVDVSKLEMGDVIDAAARTKARSRRTARSSREFALKTDVLFDEVRAGGRINLIIGRCADRQGARVPGPAAPRPLFRLPQAARSTPARASRWRRRWSAAPAACREGQGMRPGTYCEPKMTTVG